MNAQEMKALREQRQKHIADARALNDTGTKEKPLSAEDDAKVKKMLADSRAIGERLTREEELAREEAVGAGALPESQRTEPPAGPEAKEQRERYSAAMRNYLRYGYSELQAEDRQILRSGAHTPQDAAEKRAMSTLGGPGGGFTIFPDTRFGGQVISALKFFGGVERAGAEVIETDGGQDLPFVTDDDTGNVGTIVPEEASHTGGTDVTFGQKVLRAYLYSTKIVKVSLQLIQDSAIDIEGHLSSKFGTRLGRILNTHFTTGDGATKPEGIVTASAVGRAAAAGNTTSIPADDIRRLEHSVDVAYRMEPGVGYMMHDNTALEIRLLKDGNGRYLWQDSLQEGQPARLNGYPVTINNDMAQMAASAKAILFGSYGHYKIRRVRAMSVVRLNELYAENGQVGYLAFLRADGGLVDAGQNPIKHFANSAS